MQPISRIEGPSQAQVNRAIKANRPVIFTGLASDQEATLKWDLSYLKSKLAGRIVEVVTQDQARIYWDPVAGLPLSRVPFDQFATRAFSSARTGFDYLQDDVNSFPVIQQDYRLPQVFADQPIVRGKFWLSGPGLITPLHYDPVETFHWVVRGTKRFVCYSPGLRRYYPYVAGSTAPFISQVDPDHPQPERFPRFAAARPLEFQVNEGEILYLPVYWWHQVYSEGPVNISLNFVWLTTRRKKLAHLPQYLRARRHVALRLAQIAEKAKAAQTELLATRATPADRLQRTT